MTVIVETGRRQRRYLRNQAKREANNAKRSSSVGAIEEIFTFERIASCVRECCKGGMWKPGTQDFWMHQLRNTFEIYHQVREPGFLMQQLYEFDLCERGKERHIKAPTIRDRVIYKMIAKYILVPLYTVHLIETNGACVKGKGYDFSLNALSEDLHMFYRKFQRNGWIIKIDFKDYFPSALHTVLRATHERLMLNPEVRDFVDYVTDYFDPDLGENLGMETSQIEMVMYQYKLDCFIRCQLHEKYTGHYMDDGYILESDWERANEILEIIRQKAAELGLKLNEEKTGIYPLDKPFKFCKATFTLTETGKVYIKGNSRSKTTLRRKINALSQKWEETLNGTAEKPVLGEDIRNALLPSLNYLLNYDEHNSWKSLNKMIYSKFGMSIYDVEAWRAKDLDIQFKYGLITEKYYNYEKERQAKKRTPRPQQKATESITTAPEESLTLQDALILETTPTGQMRMPW